MLTALFSIALLIGAGSVFAGNDKDKDKNKDKSIGKSEVSDVRAVPEIDASSGVPAFALVLGVALLGAERLRRRSVRTS
jgi:hypothetical protein